MQQSNPVLPWVILALVIVLGIALHSCEQSKIDRCVKAGGYPVLSEGVVRACVQGRVNAATER